VKVRRPAGRPSSGGPPRRLFFDNSVAVRVASQEHGTGGLPPVLRFRVRLCMSLRKREWIVTTAVPCKHGRWLDKAVLAAGGATGRGQDQCGQATKGVWGMSWRQRAKKGVEDCDKLGGAVKRALIPRCPNRRVLNP